MADIKVLKVLSDGLYSEHSEADDSIKISSLKTANYELTDTDLGKLVDGEDADNIHHHDGRYFAKTEFIDEYDSQAEGVPVVTGTDGYIDYNFLDLAALNGDLDHGNLAGLNDDDHTIYTLADGTRAFTGDQSMGGNQLTNLGDPSAATDAVNLQTLQTYLQGLKPKEAVRVASVADLDLASAPAAIDGITLASGDRVLVKDQDDAEDNGIYVFNGAGNAMTRATDFDSISPIDEIQGSYVPVQEGTVNEGKFFVQQGPVATLGTDPINFVFFNATSNLSAGDGIDINMDVISVRLASGGGIKFVSGELSIEPNDFAGEGLVDDGSDNLALDWSTAFNDSKPVKASDLSSTSNGLGASIIGVEDAGGNFTGSDVEAVLAELYGLATAAGGVSYLAATNISKGQPVYISADGEVSLYSTLTSNVEVIGVALEDASATEQVKVAAHNAALDIAHSLDAGDRIYWSGSAFVGTMPSGAGENVWMLGTAQEEDLGMHIGVRHIKKNA